MATPLKITADETGINFQELTTDEKNELADYILWRYSHNIANTVSSTFSQTWGLHVTGGEMTFGSNIIGTPVDTYNEGEWTSNNTTLTVTNEIITQNATVQSTSDVVAPLVYDAATNTFSHATNVHSTTAGGFGDMASIFAIASAKLAANTAVAGNYKLARIITPDPSILSNTAVTNDTYDYLQQYEQNNAWLKIATLQDTYQNYYGPQTINFGLYVCQQPPKSGNTALSFNMSSSYSTSGGSLVFQTLSMSTVDKLAKSFQNYMALQGSVGAYSMTTGAAPATGTWVDAGFLTDTYYDSTTQGYSRGAYFIGYYTGKGGFDFVRSYDRNVFTRFTFPSGQTGLYTDLTFTLVYQRSDVGNYVRGDNAYYIESYNNIESYRGNSFADTAEYTRSTVESEQYFTSPTITGGYTGTVSFNGVTTFVVRDGYERIYQRTQFIPRYVAADTVYTSGTAYTRNYVRAIGATSSFLDSYTGALLAPSYDRYFSPSFTDISWSQNYVVFTLYRPATYTGTFEQTFLSPVYTYEPVAGVYQGTAYVNTQVTRTQTLYFTRYFTGYYTRLLANDTITQYYQRDPVAYTGQYTTELNFDGYGLAYFTGSRTVQYTRGVGLYTKLFTRAYVRTYGASVGPTYQKAYTGVFTGLSYAKTFSTLYLRTRVYSRTFLRAAVNYTGYATVSYIRSYGAGAGFYYTLSFSSFSVVPKIRTETFAQVLYFTTNFYYSRNFTRLATPINYTRGVGAYTGTFQGAVTTDTGVYTATRVDPGYHQNYISVYTYFDGYGSSYYTRVNERDRDSYYTRSDETYVAVYHQALQFPYTRSVYIKEYEGAKITTYKLWKRVA